MNKIVKIFFYKMVASFAWPGVNVLAYHSIADNEEFFTVKPKDFAKQMFFLKVNNYNVISLIDLLMLAQQSSVIPKHTICITFDDGYEDNFINAYPLLKKYNFPATVFVSGENIGLDVKARKGTMLRVLSVEQIKEMDKDSLIDFGAHSYHHVKMDSLESSDLKKELAFSKNILESMLGHKIVSMAYPFGRYNDEVEQAAKDFFDIICTIEGGRNFLSEQNLSRITRNSIDSEVDMIQFKGIINYGRKLFSHKVSDVFKIKR